MVNYANTQLYEIIEHDEEGNAHVYRGHTTQQLHRRLSSHRGHFKRWKEGNHKYCSSFEVLKHGPARIELVRVVCCLNKKEANREEGKFIRELPTCVNIQKNYENRIEHYQANKETINAKRKEYIKANKETINARIKEYHHANKETLNAKRIEHYQANKETINAKRKEYNKNNREKINARKHKKVKCECGVVICHNDMARHRRSWRHIYDFIHC